MITLDGERLWHQVGAGRAYVSANRREYKLSM
jgi:hypothetical protein